MSRVFKAFAREAGLSFMAQLMTSYLWVSYELEGLDVIGCRANADASLE